MVGLKSLLCTVVLALMGTLQGASAAKLGAVGQLAKLKGRHIFQSPPAKGRRLRRRSASKASFCSSRKAASAVPVTLTSITIAPSSISVAPAPPASQVPGIHVESIPAEQGSDNGQDSNSGGGEVAATTSLNTQAGGGSSSISTVAQPPPPAPPAPKPTEAPPASASSDSDANDSSDGLTDEQQQTFLQLHNSIRSQHNGAPLTWSNTLANAGKGWADKCVFQHSGGSSGPYGENLAAGTGDSYDVTAAMQSWTSEISQYDPSSPVASHYTQVVWRATTQVGCGLAPACDGIFGASFGAAKYFVCEYFPAGNVVGEFGENVQ